MYVLNCNSKIIHQSIAVLIKDLNKQINGDKKLTLSYEGFPSNMYRHLPSSR